MRAASLLPLGQGRPEQISLFVHYPEEEPVLKSLSLPPTLPQLRAVLEVTEEQQLFFSERQGARVQLERVEQLYDGAELWVTAARRRIYVRLEGARARPVVWYAGADPNQIEVTIIKACGLFPETPVEILDGDMAVVISDTIPNETHLTVVPLKPLPHLNGSSRLQMGRRASLSETSPQFRRANSTPLGSRPLSARAPTSGQLLSSAARRPVSPPTPLRSALGGGAAAQALQSFPKAPTGLEGPSSVTSARSRPLSPRSGGGRPLSPSRSLQGTGSQVLSPTYDQGSVDAQAQPTGPVSKVDEHCVHILAGHTGFVLSLCAVGDVLFTGSQDCNIMIWDLNNLQYIGTLPGHRGFVKCLAATLRRKMLCSGSQDKTIKVWSLESFSCSKTLYGHAGEVNTLTILESADALISGGEDRSMKVWDLATLTLLVWVDQAHASGIFAVKQLDAGMFISGSRDRSIKVWLTSNWQARRTLSPPHYDGISDLAVAHRQGKFYSASRDRSIRRWDTKSFESDLQLQHAQGDWITSLALSSTEQVLFTGGKDCVVKVWDTELHCKDILSGHRGPITSVLSLENHLFSSSQDRTVRVWRIDHYEETD